MQSLTATLLAEQKKPRAKPYAKVLISDKLGPHARYHWTKLYDDATDDYPCAMIIVSDDSIVRALSDNGTLRTQRITSPTTESQWETWSSSVDSCSTSNQIALCTTGAYVWLFYISTSNMVLYVRESSDYGASFGSATTVHTCTGNDRLESVAAAVTSGTDLIVFFSVEDITANLSVDLYRRKRTSGVWGSASGWGKTSVQSIRGLTVHKTGDYNMLMGVERDGQEYGFEALTYVWCIQALAYGNGVDVTADTWTTPVDVERTDAGTVYAHAWPSLAYVDTFRALYTGYTVEETTPPSSPRWPSTPRLT
jgi:hypothetical protein